MVRNDNDLGVIAYFKVEFLKMMRAAMFVACNLSRNL